MVTNSGGGYSRWNDLDLSRWRSDTTLDAWGSFLYIRDTAIGRAVGRGRQAGWAANRHRRRHISPPIAPNIIAGYSASKPSWK